MYIYVCARECIHTDEIGLITEHSFGRGLQEAIALNIHTFISMYIQIHIHRRNLYIYVYTYLHTQKKSGSLLKSPLEEDFKKLCLRLRERQSRKYGASLRLVVCVT